MKSLIFFMVVSVSLFLSQANAAILTIGTAGSPTTYTSITTLALAASSSNYAGKTIVVTSPQVVTTAISWPSDRELRFEKGGYVTFTGAGALTGLKESRPEYFGANTTPGTTDMTVAIDKAIAASSIVVFGATTYGTTGGHTITTQRVVGQGKSATTIKRLSGKNTILTLLNVGSIENLNVDGNSTDGAGITVGSNAGGYQYTGKVESVKFQNFGATVVTKSVTGATRGNPCVVTAASHGFSNGEMVYIKSISGIEPNSYSNKSILNAVFRVSNVTTNTFTIPDDTTAFTAFSAGGTVERATYALTVEQVSGGYAATNKTFNDLEFANNYGNIYLGYVVAVAFNRTVMTGITAGYGIYLSNLDCEGVVFNDTYMETGIRTQYWGIRDITFNNTRVYWNSANGWNRPWYESIGQNATYGNAGGEVAQISINGLIISRQTAQAATPLIDTNNYELTVRNMHVYENASTNWGVIRDRGTFHFRLEDVTVESTYAWDLFDPNSLGGIHTQAQNINYSQGQGGTATWSSANETSGTSGHCTVRHSNLNHKIKSGGNVRGFSFENITGNVDLTNAAIGGTYLFNVFGTVTDPNKAVSLNIKNGIDLIIHPYETYANNAAAVSAGLPVGTPYMASGSGAAPIGTLMIVY